MPSVLVVEDDRAARRAISLILKRRGFAPSEAGTVAEAIEALADEPQWLLLDLMLPDGCGSDVLQRVRADGLATRVCIITGCGSVMLDKVRTMGAEQILTKPLEVDRLIELLEAPIGT